MPSVITFVCQLGVLEAKAVLLAASLRRHLSETARLVACLPAPETTWGRPTRRTLMALEALGADVVRVRNPIDDRYPIGNKIACLVPPAGAPADRVIFLDSDILCTATFAPDRDLAGDFCAKPADFATFRGGPDEWARLYGLFGLAAPTRRMVATVSGDETCPYFNAGVVGVRADAGLAEVWADSCRRIDAEEWVPSRRPHLDQIALPIAAARCGLECTLLDEDLNFPAHVRPLRSGPPVLCHYHDPGIVAREPMLATLVASLVAEEPAVRPVVETDPAWRCVPLPPRRTWWPGLARPTAPVLGGAPPAAAPNDVPAAALADALARSPTPRVLQTLVDVSRRRFGWFTRHPSRAFEYPWVVDRLASLRSGAVVDVGAGVSPVPLFLALRGLRVTTVDDSTVVRDPAAGTDGWDEWGFLDYAALDPAIHSFNGDAIDLDLPPGSCAAAYSVSVIEHVPAATRRRLWPRIAAWLAAGGRLLLTIDLEPGTDRLWNRASGREVDPPGTHGDLGALTAELAGTGLVAGQRTDLRGLPGMRADVALLEFTKS
ncbi:MAG: methyltransferase domain-containing protein [Planctomycetaceae bacterium]